MSVLRGNGAVRNGEQEKGAVAPTTAYSWLSVGERVVAEFGRAQMGAGTDWKGIGLRVLSAAASGAASGATQGMRIPGQTAYGEKKRANLFSNNSRPTPVRPSNNADIYAENLLVTDRRLVLLNADGSIAFEAIRDLGYARDVMIHIAPRVKEEMHTLGSKPTTLYFVKTVKMNGDSKLEIMFEKLATSLLVVAAKGFMSPSLLTDVKLKLELQDGARASEFSNAIGSNTELVAYALNSAQIVSDYKQGAQ